MHEEIRGIEAKKPVTALEDEYCRADAGKRTFNLFDLYPEIDDILGVMDADMREHTEKQLEYYRTHHVAPERIDQEVQSFVGGFRFPFGPRAEKGDRERWKEVMDTLQGDLNEIEKKRQRLEERRTQAQEN